MPTGLRQRVPLFTGVMGELEEMTLSRPVFGFNSYLWNLQCKTSSPLRRVVCTSW
jgi:hypothetical protein